MKKALAIMLTALAPCLASAQTTNNFTITGHIGKLNAPAKAYLDFMDNMDNGANHIDSAVVINGTFKFTGRNSGYATARMALSHDGSGKDRAIYTPNADVIYIYFGKETIDITSKDSLSNAVFTGSKVYDEYQAFVKATGGTVMQFAKEANAEISSTPELQNDQDFIKEVGDRYHKKMDDHAAKQIQFAKDHPDSYFGLVGLSEGIGNKFDPKQVFPIFNALKKEYQQTDAGKELKQRIEAMENIVIGAQAPAFTQNDVNGKPVSLASYKGKYVLVDFWASWCSPCRAENPNLVDQYKIYKDKGFEIISVSLDSDHAKWANAIAADNLTWTHVSDLKGWNNAVGQLYGVRAVPQNYLLDKDGKVIGINLKGDDLIKKLAETFKN
ncbi:TlpA disulfide reductase family protein [Mucilaginibacter flavus]|uniref:TlpA disulfide reductase family protein n=1 Tax=Mucilaginibacter flavus TaxID=931504 RepID=UPI0025B48C02|nr:TlpA disulfide reductase family protein [Mucilaginibacter flavus]MDN3582399.1 TlpA disulfide reductase family protein [Mucilaginibacter flavus]